jgi:valyl-tRNA synthetase
MEGLAKTYVPGEHEANVWKRWEASGAFHADPARVLRGEAEPYAVVIPPPNVTDRLHVGHALNNTLQDILVRAHRMMGFETLWMPGTDHAGIATQAVVERRLRAEGALKGPLREAFTREEFIAKVQAFKDEYEATITGQLKAMGCSCDWARQRFTMDEVCARAVREAFFRLFKDGLIYRGKRLVNWDPALQTAVADDEVEDIEVDGFFYYLRYPLMHPWDGDDEPTPVTWSELFARGYPRPAEMGDAHKAGEYGDDKPAWVTVATTRPETYLGDTAVAVNPRDPRAGALRGLCVELPLVGRAIPVIEDEYVVLPAAMQEDPEAAKGDPKAAYATGFLKVTPAHDANDWEIGQRHKLKVINIFAPDATISDKHGWDDPEELRNAHLFLGLTREAGRKKVVAEFHARGLLEATRPYKHSVAHSDRSKAAIEPYLSDQWYVRVTDERMRGSALGAMAPEQRTVNPDRKGGARRAAEQQSSRAADRADQAGDGALRFHPERYARTFETWHENIRDWCISRQLWWGHRIAVWSKSCAPGPNEAFMELDQILPDLLEDVLDGKGNESAVRIVDAATGDPLRPTALEFNHGFARATRIFVVVSPSSKHANALERNGWVQDPDVLDTWFSSGLWPMSTMGWPDPKAAGPEFDGLLEAFNPTSTLCTAREIITLWVSRMTMFNRYFMPEGWEEKARRHEGTEARSGNGKGPVPFRDVFIHAMIQDGEGRKMSKSLGNGVDPLDIIASHGTDALRFALCQMTTATQDIRLPVEKDPKTGRNTSPKFDQGRNFCNKLWNATRFSIGILSDGATERRSDKGVGSERSLVDRWMLSRLEAGVREATAALTEFRFSEYAQTLYTLLWGDFCDRYLEAIKPTVGSSASQRAVLAHALETIVRLLHPIAPFVTESIWEHLREVETEPVAGITLGASRKAGLLCTAGWPRIDAMLRDEAAEREFERAHALVTAINQVRAQHRVVPKRRITLHAADRGTRELIARAGWVVETLAGLARVDDGPPTAGATAFRFESADLFLSDMADAIDAGAERAMIAKQASELEKSIKTYQGRLANPGYADKAPPAMVQQTRDALAKAQAELDELRKKME